MRSKSKDKLENRLDINMLVKKQQKHYEVFDKIYFEDQNDEISESILAPKADKLIKRLK